MIAAIVITVVQLLDIHTLTYDTLILIVVLIVVAIIAFIAGAYVGKGGGISVTK